MAESRPSPDLDRIASDLRNLVTPDLEDVAALVAETRRNRAVIAAYGLGFVQMASIIQRVTEETT